MADVGRAQRGGTVRPAREARLPVPRLARRAIRFADTSQVSKAGAVPVAFPIQPVQNTREMQAVKKKPGLCAIMRNGVSGRSVIGNRRGRLASHERAT